MRMHEENAPENSFVVRPISVLSSCHRAFLLYHKSEGSLIDKKRNCKGSVRGRHKFSGPFQAEIAKINGINCWGLIR